MRQLGRHESFGFMTRNIQEKYTRGQEPLEAAIVTFA
jgi:hypothetical protein